MKFNIELLKLALHLIQNNPQHWNQADWHCGTTHCIAGFVVLIAFGIPVDADEKDVASTLIGFSSNQRADIYKRYQPGSCRHPQTIHTLKLAQFLLGIDDYDAQCLFADDNTLKDLKNMVKELEVNKTLTGSQTVLEKAKR